jgi:hypothetical protein
VIVDACGALVCSCFSNHFLLPSIQIYSRSNKAAEYTGQFVSFEAMWVRVLFGLAIFVLLSQHNEQISKGADMSNGKGVKKIYFATHTIILLCNLVLPKCQIALFL